MGVSAIDDDISLVEYGDELLDEVIYSLTGLDHKEDLPRALERSDEVLKRVGSVDVLVLSAAVDELVHLLHGTVVNAYMEAFALHVEDQVLAHYGKTYKSDIRNWFHCCWYYLIFNLLLH